MAPGSLRDLQRNGPCPQSDGRVTTRGTVQVTSALGLKTPQGLHALVQEDVQGRSCEEVPPGPGVSQRAPTGNQSPKGWTVKEVSCSRGDVEGGETPEAA